MKSWWRHIWLAIKPCYLRNHGSQKNICYGTLSGSYGRSFRIRHVKSREAPPGGQITMMSYPACKKSRYLAKPCFTDEKLQWITFTKSWSLSNFYKNNSKYYFKKHNRLCYWVKWKKYICCFMRVTHAINNIYKLIIFLKNNHTVKSQHGISCRPGTAILW